MPTFPFLPVKYCFLHFMCSQEISYLDQVLDAASETPTNGDPSLSEHTKPISINGTSSSVCVSDNRQSITVEEQRSSTFPHLESAVRTNGHIQGDESGHGAVKFELRAFQEERRPAKLFTPGEEQQVRVTRRRPSEEVMCVVCSRSTTTAKIHTGVLFGFFSDTFFFE